METITSPIVQNNSYSLNMLAYICDCENANLEKTHTSQTPIDLSYAESPTPTNTSDTCSSSLDNQSTLNNICSSSNHYPSPSPSQNFKPQAPVLISASYPHLNHQNTLNNNSFSSNHYPYDYQNITPPPLISTSTSSPYSSRLNYQSVSNAIHHFPHLSHRFIAPKQASYSVVQKQTVATSKKKEIEGYFHVTLKSGRQKSHHAIYGIVGSQIYNGMIAQKTLDWVAVSEEASNRLSKEWMENKNIYLNQSGNEITDPQAIKCFNIFLKEIPKKQIDYTLNAITIDKTTNNCFYYIKHPNHGYRIAAKKNFEKHAFITTCPGTVSIRPTKQHQQQNSIALIPKRIIPKCLDSENCSLLINSGFLSSEKKLLRNRYIISINLAKKGNFSLFANDEDGFDRNIKLVIVWNNAHEAVEIAIQATRNIEPDEPLVLRYSKENYWRPFKKAYKKKLTGDTP